MVCGDGSLGYPPGAPFDAISVAAGSPEVPAALVDQLRDPGRLVIPVGNRLEQELYFVQKKNGQILTRTLTGCRFVPLVGRQGWG